MTFEFPRRSERGVNRRAPFVTAATRRPTGLLGLDVPLREHARDNEHEIPVDPILSLSEAGGVAATIFEGQIG